MIKIIQEETPQNLQDKVNMFTTHTPCFAQHTLITPYDGGILYTAVLFYNEVKRK